MNDCTATGMACIRRFEAHIGFYPTETQERVFDAIKAAERAALIRERLAEIWRVDYPRLPISTAAKAIADALERLSRSQHRIRLGAISESEIRLLRLPDDCPRSWRRIMGYLE
jgi:hypothetical protein